MSGAMTLGAEQWFDKGTEAANARQWDYAIECLSNAIRLSPETLVYRRSKYRACRKLHKDGPGSIPSVKVVDIRRKLLQARMTKNWAGVDKWAEAGISENPWDAQFFAHVAVACTEMQHREVARYAWVMALKLDTSNVSYNREFGRFLCVEQDYDAATQCFRRILKEDPEDRYSSEMLRYIDVERLINKQGYGSADSTRDVEQAPAMPANQHDSKEGLFALGVGGVFDLAPGQGTATTAESKDSQKAAQLRLARRCADQRQWDQCIAAYRKALELAPDEASIKEQLENAELSQMRENVERVKRAADNPNASEELRVQAVDQERQLIERRLEVNSRRIARYPTDMQLRFEMAEDYSRLGQYKEAIPLYQQACKNTNLREQALLKLGQCWICDGQKELACRQFEMALKTLTPSAHPDSWKTAHYWLGRLNESEGKTIEAKSHYSEVMLVDYGYRDTVVRLEALQSGMFNTV